MTTLGQVLISLGICVVVVLPPGGPAPAWLADPLRFIGLFVLILGLHFFRVGLKRDIIAEIKGGESSTSKPFG
jgi:hypothetical protein